MGQTEDLARLEQFVEKLIESYNRLKNDNNDMMAQLQAKQQELEELQNSLEDLQSDRSVLHNRVTGLIDRIGEWEKIIELEEPGHNPNSKAGNAKNPAKKSSTLFKVKKGQSSESALR